MLTIELDEIDKREIIIKQLQGAKDKEKRLRVMLAKDEFKEVPTVSKKVGIVAFIHSILP